MAPAHGSASVNSVPSGPFISKMNPNGRGPRLKSRGSLSRCWCVRTVQVCARLPKKVCRTSLKEREMRKVLSIAALVLVAGLGVSLMSARGAAPANGASNDAPKAAPSPSAAVLAQWNDIGRKLIAMAEDFPDDKYEFKPVPEERTF